MRSHAVAATELLETKVLLAADTLGLIQGTVFNDVSDNGLTGEDPTLAAATVQLYKDGGNLTFDNGGADDTPVGSVTTIAGGEFSFSNLGEGRYFVRQLALAGYVQQTGDDVVTVDISATDALGMPGTLIDDFANPTVPGQSLTVNSAGTATDSSVAASTTAIGGERDMTVTAVLGSITLEANGSAFPSFLNYNANFGATGNARVVWDGPDGNATTLDPSGLGGADLTVGDAAGFLFSIGTSQAATIQVIVHSGTGNSSTTTLALPASATETLYIPFSAFTTTTGTGADFANVGAIEFFIDAPVATTTTVTDLMQTQAPTIFTTNFANFIPMTLGNLVFHDINNNGVFDSGTEVGINNVAMTLFEDTNGNNSFDSGDLPLATTTTAGGGLYSFGNLFPGDYIVRIDASNFGVAGALPGFESSTGNGVAPDADTNSTNGDDNGDALSGAIVSQAITLTNGAEPADDGDTDVNTNLSLDFGVFGSVDIVVTKTDNVDPVIAGSGVGNLVYTVTASNSGAATATGLTISDTGVLAANLPAGVTFVSANGSGSTTFNTATGIWAIGTLASGASETLTVTLTVGATALDTLVISNTATLATVNEIEIDAVAGNDTDTETTNVDRSVDIAVLKTASVSTVVAGSGAGNLVYTVTATNNGPSNATGVTLTDTDILSANLPTGVTLVSAVGSGGSTFNSTTGIWTIGNLASGASVILTATLTVSASVSDGLSIDNTASLLAVTETDSNQLNNSATASADVERNVDLEVTKTVNATTIEAGSGAGNLVYTVTARNIGPSDASGVTLSDVDILAGNLPAGVTFVSGVGSGTTTFNSTTGLWTIGNLAAGSSATLVITLTVEASAANNLAIPNTAAVDTVNENDTDPLNDSDQETATAVRDVDIVITKIANTSTVIAGSGIGNLTYTITARNAGPSNSSGVTVNDVGIFAATALPGISVVSATPSSSTTFDLSSGIWTIGNLAAGAAETLLVTLTVDAAATNGLVINNTASLSAITETDRDLTNNSQSVVVNVARNVDIAVTKVALPTTPTAVIAGSGAGNLVYTVTARNNGISNASGVAVSDADILAANLPAGVTFVSAVGSGATTFNTTTGIWTVGNLAVGASATLTVTLTVGAAASDTLVISNTAALAQVNETDTVSSNNSQAVTTNVDRRVDISLLKSTANNPVIAGSGTGNLVYTVTATNNGPSDASGVSVRDNNLLPANLPAGVTFVSAVGDGGSTWNSTTGIWTINHLAAAATRTLTVTLTVGAAAVPQTYNNTVDVATVTETDRVAGNNSAAAATVFQRSVDIEVRKTATTGPIIAGSGAGNLVYTVTAQNKGPSNASGVTVSDTGVLTANLPAGVSFVSATGSDGSTFNTTTGIWTIGNLATTQTATLTVVLTVGASASDTLAISNTALLSTVTETDTVSTNNSQSVTMQVDRLVDIAITKSAAPANVAAGSGVGNLVYTVTARNEGSSNASGVTISDFGVLPSSLPAGVTLVSGTGSNGSTFNTTTGIWTIGDLDAGASRTLTLTLTVASNTAHGINISNTATVSTVAENESRTDNNSQTSSSRVTGVVDLRVVKTGTPNPVLSPGILTYSVVVTNHGTAPAAGVVLVDNLGTGMTFSSGTSTQGTVTNANGIVTTTIGTLAAGASATLTLFASVNVALDGTLVNTAVATADQTDLNPGDNTRSIETQARLAPTSVSGIVFQDLNKNGLRDASEKLLTDVQIVLLGIDRNGVAVNQQAVTNSNGAYSFTNLVPGRYTVYEIQPGIYLDGNEVAGTGATGTIGNDAFLNLQLQPGVAATAFNFTEGAVDPSKRPFLASSQSVGETTVVSMPVTGSGSLSGSVATDANRSSTLDNGDIGLPGVLVTLAGNDAAGNAVLIHQTTDTLGRFSFRNLPAGQYSLLESQPFGKTDGAEQAGTILPDQVLDNIFSMIALPNGGAGTGYNFLELPAAPGTTAATFPTLLTPTTSDVGLRPTFSWTSLTNAAKYEVAVNRITDNVGEVYRNTNVTGTSITMPTDLALGSHRVWVRAINSSGVAGPWSQPLAFNVATQANALQVLGVSLNAGQKLDWADVPNSRSYDLRLINVETGAVLANATNLPSSQYTGLATLPPGKYRYFVRGNTATSTGLWSDGFDYSVLSIPVLKSATSTDTAKPTLHWNPVKGATMYEVWLSKISENGSAQRVTTVNKTNATSIPMPTRLEPGNYRYWVRAIDSLGKMTSWSAASDLRIEAVGKMLTPSGTTTSTTPAFTWQAVAGAVKYDLWVADQSGQVYVREQNLTGTSFTSTKGFVNGDYRAWVMPVGATTPGKWSTALAFTVKNVARPEFTSPGATTNSTPKIQWTPAATAVRYELWVDKVGGPSKVVHSTNVTTNSYKPLTSLAAGTYRAWVRAFDATGAASVWSVALDFRVV